METMSEASAVEYEPEVLTMTTEESIEEAGDTTHMSECLRKVNAYEN